MVIEEAASVAGRVGEVGKSSMNVTTFTTRVAQDDESGCR